MIAINSGGTSISSGASSSITTKPESPTIGIITVLGPTEVSVSFTPNEPGTLIDYIVTSNLGDIGTGTSSPIIVSGLTSNTSYTFSVTATISDRTSFASSTSSSVTTKLSALIIDNIIVLRTSEINVSFTSPNGGDGTITYYNVTSSPGGLIGTGTSSPITVTGLTANTTYTFIVSAIRHMTSRRPIVLSVSNVSSPISTISDPPTLGIITVLDKTSVNIEFTPPSKGNGIITCYTATSSPRGLIGTGTSSPITITGLTPYESYTFTITATNSGGTSIQSNTSSYISPY